MTVDDRHAPEREGGRQDHYVTSEILTQYAEWNGEVLYKLLFINRRK